MKLVLDCERDLKGLHDWQEITPASLEAGKVPQVARCWCGTCGAIGTRDYGVSVIKVVKRIGCLRKGN